ncbi:hypothetical protein BKA61DRAFT_7520 [Leptodontidium sp. MPI-SDFR-AT-0119]|nr:hypothetical protein BKA61DRAFT_7520 [Leptodontidium sp. MPI-SDFR-AT-0119]
MSTSHYNINSNQQTREIGTCCYPYWYSCTTHWTRFLLLSFVMATSASRIYLLSLNFFHFVHPTWASSFKPNCTLAPAGTNYVSGSNTRGTISILWNCLSIIFLCTWSIQHLNVPASRPHAKNFIQKAWWDALDSRAKVKWMTSPCWFLRTWSGKHLMSGSQQIGVGLYHRSQKSTV